MYMKIIQNETLRPVNVYILAGNILGTCIVQMKSFVRNNGYHSSTMLFVRCASVNIDF